MIPALAQVVFGCSDARLLAPRERVIFRVVLRLDAAVVTHLDHAGGI